MKKKTLVIAYNAQKGGAGKSTYTIITASYLHYVKQLTVAVIDCDAPQYSVLATRQREISLINSSPEVAQIISEQGFSEYEIFKCDTKNVVKQIEELREKDCYDVVLVDMPGTINMPGIVNAFAVMDYIFCPVCPNEIYLNSSLLFLTFIQDEIVHGGFVLKGIYAFWNRMVASENKEIYNRYNARYDNLRIRRLSTEIPASVKFNKELFRAKSTVFISTFLAPDRKMMFESRCLALMNEICNMMNL